MLFAATHAWSAPADAPAVKADARAEFRAVFCSLMARDFPLGAGCDEWLRRFPDEAAPAAATAAGGAAAVNIVIVGGLFSECLPTIPTFGDAVTHLRGMGYRVSYAPVKGRASAEANAAIVRTHVAQELAAAPKLPLVIVAYSKGVTDTITALANYPQLGGEVGAVIGVAGVVNGSRAADQLLALYGATAGLLPYSGCPASDGGELRTLTHEYRASWLMTHRLPAEPLYFSIVGLPTPERVSAVFAPFERSLSRIDPRNDGQMIYSDAILPNSALLAYANADHFAIALPIENAVREARLVGINHNDFPRAQLIEAAIRIAQARLADKPR
ncbi:MAG TPA: hypothetical protein VFS02_07220 [Telluria sp.]|nr:hypothetical protein [Telluria sp.]